MNKGQSVFDYFSLYQRWKHSHNHPKTPDGGRRPMTISAFDESSVNQRMNDERKEEGLKEDTQQMEAEFVPAKNDCSESLKETLQLPNPEVSSIDSEGLMVEHHHRRRILRRDASYDTIDNQMANSLIVTWATNSGSKSERYGVHPRGPFSRHQ